MWRNRWIALLLNAGLLLGNYYAYDNPAALSVLLEEYMKIEHEQFMFYYGLLYSLYSFPNILLPFFAGHFIERFGSKSVLLVLSSFVCMGQALFATGVMIRQPWLMLLGRVLFGIGGESVSVVQSCITTKWFHEKELAFALGFNLALPRVGSLLNYVLSPLIAVNFNVPAACWVGFAMCFSSLLCAVIICFWLGVEPPKNNSPGDEEEPLLFLGEEVSISPIMLKSEPFFQVFKRVLSETYHSMAEMPRSFWILCAIVMMIYGTIVPFNNIISEFLQIKWFDHNSVLAGTVMVSYISLNLMGQAIPDTLCGALVPIFGYAVDRYGKRASLLFFCCVGMTFVHLVLAFSPFPTKDHDYSRILVPILPLFLLGFCYSVYGVAFWSSVASVFSDSEVKQEEVETEAPKSVLQKFIQEQELKSVASSPNMSMHRKSLHNSPALRLKFNSLGRRNSSLSINNISTTTLPLLAASRGVSAYPPFPAVFINPVENSDGLNITISPENTSEEASLQSFTPIEDAAVERGLEHHLAVAYGISVSAMNFSLTVVPLVVAAIRGDTPVSNPEEFFTLEVFFAVETGIAALLSVWLYINDFSEGSCLERSHYKVD